MFADFVMLLGFTLQLKNSTTKINAQNSMTKFNTHHILFMVQNPEKPENFLQTMISKPLKIILYFYVLTSFNMLSLYLKQYITILALFFPMTVINSSHKKQWLHVFLCLFLGFVSNNLLRTLRVLQGSAVCFFCSTAFWSSALYSTLLHVCCRASALDDLLIRCTCLQQIMLALGSRQVVKLVHY